MIGNAMLGDYEQYSHAPSSKLVYNLHTLVFLGIVRRQGSCKTLRSKHHQTVSFNSTFPVKISTCVRKSPQPQQQMRRCSSAGESREGLSPPFHRVYNPRDLLQLRGSDTRQREAQQAMNFSVAPFCLPFPDTPRRTTNPG